MAATASSSSGCSRSTATTTTSAWISSIRTVDFTGLAKSLGLEAMQITDPGAVEVALVIGVQPPRREADRGGRDGNSVN